LPPAPKGTITVIGLDGQLSWAAAGKWAQHVILSIWQAVHRMIAKGCSLRNPGDICQHWSEF
jgi:hypothetical protein